MHLYFLVICSEFKRIPSSNSFCKESMLQFSHCLEQSILLLGLKSLLPERRARIEQKSSIQQKVDSGFQSSPGTGEVILFQANSFAEWSTRETSSYTVTWWVWTMLMRLLQASYPSCAQGEFQEEQLCQERYSFEWQDCDQLMCRHALANDIQGASPRSCTAQANSDQTERPCEKGLLVPFFPAESKLPKGW